jgi:hypothetical protein
MTLNCDTIWRTSWSHRAADVSEDSRWLWLGVKLAGCRILGSAVLDVETRLWLPIDGE